MNRRAALVASAASALAFAARSGAAPGTSGHEITLGVVPGAKSGEFTYSVSLRSSETGKRHVQEGVVATGTSAAVRVGEGRPDGSSLDLLVDVSIDAKAEQVRFAATLTDRGQTITVQRTAVSLPRT